MARRDIEERVRRVAEQALAEQHYVRPVDVLLGLGWLAPSHLNEWRQGRVPYLERVVQASLGKVSTAMAEFRRWARERDPGIERAYRTHWVSPVLSERKRRRLAERQSRPPELVVVSATKPWTCARCRAESGAGAVLLMQDEGPLCLDCADLGHLEYLPAGDAALTRRAAKLSRESAVVVRWSRSRKRYERQGILVEAEALAQAEAERLT